MDYTNIPLGMRVQSQIPLDVKTYKQSENELKNLGPNNNLAFTYMKGLIVYCIQEETRYEWKEMTPDDIGLLDNNFIYPDNIVTFGIDYSNKEYNFVNIAPSQIIPNLQNVLDAGNNARAQSISLKPDDTFDHHEFYVNQEILQLTDFGNNLTELTAEYIKISDFNNERQIKIERRRVIFADAGITSNLEVNPSSIGDGLLYLPIINTGQTKTLATEDQIPVVDGSETKVVNSSTITHVGVGSILDPYQFNLVQNPNQKIITYPANFTGTNYNLIPDDNNKLFIINNGSTNVTITASVGLPDEFFAAFIRKGTGEVTMVESGVTINSSVGKRINRQFDQVALDKEGSTTIFYLTGNTKI